MSHACKELPIPPAARADGTSIEMLRAWIANGALYCSLEMGICKEDKIGAWGVLLADVVRHAANAMQEATGEDVAHSMAAIRRAFNAEMDYPTDAPSGAFVQ
jgi:hypothetical protein